MQVPVSLKSILPYLKRAEDLDKADVPNARIVAYFCRLRAIDSAIKMKNASNKEDVQTVVISLLSVQEQARVQLGDDAKAENGQIICEDFALTQFAQADDQGKNILILYLLALKLT
jgi:hypothetical protein